MQVGNALTDDYNDRLGIFQFMWSAGLISDDTYKLLNDLCDNESFIHSSSSCEKMLDVASEELGNIDPYSIYTPSCVANVSQSNWLLKKMRVRTCYLNHILNCWNLFKLLVLSPYYLNLLYHTAFIVREFAFCCLAI